MTLPNEAILVRIKKLLALAASSNEHEAALAASKAQALLTQHNIAMSEIESLDLRREGVDQFDWSDVVNPSNKSFEWRDTLMKAVTDTTYCKAWSSDRSVGSFYDAAGRYRQRMQRRTIVIGRPSDVEVARYLYVFLATTLERLAKEFIAREANPWWPRGRANSERHGFLKGAADVIYWRLANEWKERREAATATNALVVVRDAELRDWMGSHGVNLTKSKNYHRDGGYAGRVAGAQAASDIQLSRGVEGGSASPSDIQLSRGVEGGSASPTKQIR